MFDYVDFQHREGSIKDRELKLFALSTCGFCKKAMAFLEENNLDYEYIFVDLIDSEVKNKIKADFEKRFEKKMLFPTLIVDDEEFLVGFIKFYWQKLAA
ncbi:glutaredoxin family protein [Marispirochaeta aestuarii]|nr:glutaredoxin family protein [Marispirochaeta aestuarii]